MFFEHFVEIWWSLENSEKSIFARILFIFKNFLKPFHFKASLHFKIFSLPQAQKPLIQSKKGGKLRLPTFWY